jgi:hypothetical protein
MARLGVCNRDKQGDGMVIRTGTGEVDFDNRVLTIAIISRDVAWGIKGGITGMKEGRRGISAKYVEEGFKGGGRRRKKAGRRAEKVGRRDDDY